MFDHAAAAFADGGTVLNLSFGTVQHGSHALPFHIQNLAAAYRAGLDLDSSTELSNPSGVFSTEAMPFSDLAPGMESGNSVVVDSSQDGQFSPSISSICRMKRTSAAMPGHKRSCSM